MAKSATADYYWVAFRQNYSNPRLKRGAYLNWEKPAGGINRHQCWLVDTTPGSAGNQDDAGLALGWTYSDAASAVHITPVATGGTAPGEWLDVRVNLGPFPGNTAPTGTLSAPVSVRARQPLRFSVAASDQDGDALAYAWDLGDGAVPDNTPVITTTWLAGWTGTIACTVSDMKGGTCRLTQAVEVVDPLDTWQARSGGGTDNLTGIAAGSNLVVAVGAKKVYYSTNGTNWSATPNVGVNVYLGDVIWTGARFVAVGMDYDFALTNWEGVVYTSSNGISWTRKYESNAADTRLYAAAASGSGQVIIAAGTRGAAARSLDGGTTWGALATTGVAAGWRINDIAWGDGAFLIGGGYSGGSGGFFAKVSTNDGASWTDVSAALALDAGNWQDLREVEYLGDRFGVSGWYAGLRTTLDGSVFVAHGSRRYALAGMARMGPLYFATGVDVDRANADTTPLDVELVSLDGSNWAERAGGAVADRNEVAVFRNTLITVGDGGSIRQAVGVLEGYDGWAYARFPGWGASALPTADPDGDGANNLMEYAFGTEPNNPASRPAGVTGVTGPDGFELCATRDGRVSDLRCTAERSEDLRVWSEDGLEVVTNTVELLRVRATNTLYPRLFMRLRVDRP